MLFKIFHIRAISRNAGNQFDLAVCSVGYKAVFIKRSANSA